MPRQIHRLSKTLLSLPLPTEAHLLNIPLPLSTENPSQLNNPNMSNDPIIETLRHYSRYKPEIFPAN